MRKFESAPNLVPGACKCVETRRCWAYKCLSAVTVGSYYENDDDPACASIVKRDTLVPVHFHAANILSDSVQAGCFGERQ